MGTLGVSTVEHGVMSPEGISLGNDGGAAVPALEGEKRLAESSARSRRQLDENPRFPCAGSAVVSRSLEGVKVMTPREAFLQRVRQAVAEGNHGGAAPRSYPERGSVGYQGAGTDPVERFCTELAAAGGKGYVVPDRETAWRTMQSIIQAHAARKILLSRGGLVERLDIPARLKELGLDVTTTDMLPLHHPREGLFAAEIGISNVHRLIAETGTVVLASRPNEPRSVSLLRSEEHTSELQSRGLIS